MRMRPAPTTAPTAAGAATAVHTGGGDVERTALKEWDVLVRAMARGEIIALVRKGGIRERRAGFVVRHDRFLLYPTRFHENVGELAPRLRGSLEAGAGAPRDGPNSVPITLVAEVERVWALSALEPLRAIEMAHGLAWRAVESRFRYREPGIQVVAVRVARLRSPVTRPELPRYRGCVSWVELDEDVDVTDAAPVLSDAELGERVARLDAALSRA